MERPSWFNRRRIHGDYGMDAACIHGVGIFSIIGKFILSRWTALRVHSAQKILAEENIRTSLLDKVL